MTQIERKEGLRFLKDFLPGFGVVLMAGLLAIEIAVAIQTNHTSERTQQLLEKAIAQDSVRPLSRARWERIETKVDAVLLNQSEGKTRSVIRDSKIDTLVHKIIK